MIATNVGGLGEIVLDGQTGIVCSPDVEGIAGAIDQFYTQNLGEKFTANMPEAKKRFSWESAVEALVECAEIKK